MNNVDDDAKNQFIQKGSDMSEADDGGNEII